MTLVFGFAIDSVPRIGASLRKHGYDATKVTLLEHCESNKYNEQDIQKVIDRLNAINANKERKAGR